MRPGHCTAKIPQRMGTHKLQRYRPIITRFSPAASAQSSKILGQLMGERAPAAVTPSKAVVCNTNMQHTKRVKNLYNKSRHTKSQLRSEPFLGRHQIL